MSRALPLTTTALCLLFAAPAPAQISGSIGGDFTVLDRKQIFLTGSLVAHDLSLLRAADGSLALAEASAGAPVRLAALGLTMPAGSTWGSIVVRPGDASGAEHTLLALVFDAEIRLLDIGSLANPGSLTLASLGSIQVSGAWTPRSTAVDIIAILIGQVIESRAPAVRFQACSASACEVVYGFDGQGLRQVHLIEEEGIWR